MIDIILFLIKTLAIFIGIASIPFLLAAILGYVVYRFHLSDAKSWEDAAKAILDGMKSGIYSLYRFFTNYVPPEELINTALSLTDEEVLELIKRFDKHPYDTPTLNTYDPNVNGISWYDLRACGLSSEYKFLSLEDIRKITLYTIQNFFMETRGLKPDVYIKVASPTRLYFAIPLCRKSRDFLENQSRELHQMPEVPSVPDIIEEEIILDEISHTDHL